MVKTKTKVGAADPEDHCPKRSAFMEEKLPHVGRFYCPWCGIKIIESED